MKDKLIEELYLNLCGQMLKQNQKYVNKNNIFYSGDKL